MKNYLCLLLLAFSFAVDGHNKQGSLLDDESNLFNVDDED